MSDSSKETEQDIVEAMDELRAALSSQDPVRICEQSRILYFEVNSVFAHPELWSEARVEEVSELLRRSAAATRGTEMEQNCAERAARFRTRFEGMIEAKEIFDEVTQETRLAAHVSTSSKD